LAFLLEPPMTANILIHDDVYRWPGWGGRMQLGSGRCRLRIFDLRRGPGKGLSHLKPVIAVVSDLPKKRMNDMSVRSCTGHIATCVARDFAIDPQRMLWIEYYPERLYGAGQEKAVPQSLVAVDLTWREGLAIEPRWRPLPSPLYETVLDLIQTTPLEIPED
jgi:hypothetical protein